MNELLLDTILLVNGVFAVTFGKILKFMNIFPYWASLVLVSCLMGVAFVFVFKYFSNQSAIFRIRNRVTAELISIRIFKDNPKVMLRAQGRILAGSLALLWHTLPSVLIVIVPVMFLLSQMSGWYQFRPLNIDEKAVITVKIAPDADYQSLDIRLDPPESVAVLTGPVRIYSRNEIAWTISGKADGVGHLNFTTPDKSVAKKLVTGEHRNPVSIRIPDRHPAEAFLYPFESPTGPDSPIRSIVLTYGDTATDPLQRFDWLVVFCIVSMVVFLIFKRFFKVSV